MTCIHNSKVLARFWAKVDKSGDCWEWTACKNSDGYGLLAVGLKARRSKGAHRFSWEIHFGHIPDGMCVCHSCDNPSCVNPNHLFIASHADNMADMARKGRGVRSGLKGELHGGVKLTENQVVMIRASRAEGRKLTDIANEYGVTFQLISRICLRQLWGHI